MRTGLCCGLAVVALVPTPIGVGSRFHPPAHGSLSALPSCVRAPLRQGLRVHLELFAQRRVVIVAAGIGLRAASFRHGDVVHARCRAPLWTVDPTGVVRLERPGLRLGELFAIWGQPLGPVRLAGFHGRVSVFVDGVRRRGDPRGLALRDRAEVVLEVGGFVPPHRSFRFPP